MNKKAIKFIVIFIGIYFIVTFSQQLYGAKNKTNYSEMGNKYYIEHNYDEAIKAYEKSLELGSKAFEVFYNLGLIYYEKNDLKRSEQIFKKGILIYPKVDVLHSALSQVYFGMNDFFEAVEEYKKSVEFNKGRTIVINMRKARELLKQQKKSDKEINAFFQEIVVFNPKDYYALYEVAKYDMNNKKYSQALSQFKKILMLNSNQTYVYADMATCYYNLGEAKLGDEYLKKSKIAENENFKLFLKSRANK